MEKIVVTRHPALVQFLQEEGLVEESTPVLSHADAEDVRGKHAFGVLPLHLAAAAAKVTEVPLALRPEHRGQELDLATMREVAGDPVTYVICAEREFGAISDRIEAGGAACPDPFYYLKG